MDDPTWTDLPLPDNDEIVTHFGSVRSGFHNRPRKEAGETYQSVILGRKSVSEAAAVVRTDKLPLPGDAVRYSTVKALLDAGFSVKRKPLLRNPDHAGAEYSGEWDDDVSSRFDECFGEPVTEDQKDG